MKQAIRKPPAGMASAIAVAIILAAGLAIGQQDQAATDAVAWDPALQTSEMMPLATKSIILDVVNANSRAIAVGERGHVLVSESRQDWRQVANIPTRSTLTAVSAVADKVWAVGHDGVILHSADGGLTWVRQRATPYVPGDLSTHNGAPLLDVLFLDQSNGIAIGAYAWMLRTTDGGTTWAVSPMPGASNSAVVGESDSEDDDDSWTMSADETAIAEETDPHLNAIARTGDGSLFIVGERGAAYRSFDAGTNWERITLPYDGSMFGVIGYTGRHVLAFGLRGNVLESHDLGTTWMQIESGAQLSLMGGTGWENGGAALVGANGVVLTRSQGNSNLLRHDHPGGAVLAAVISLAPNGELVVAGENGIGTWTPN